MNKVLLQLFSILLLASCAVKHKIASQVSISAVTSADGAIAEIYKDSTKTYSYLARIDASKMAFHAGLPDSEAMKNDRIFVVLSYQNLTDKDIRIVDLFSDMDVNFSLFISSPHMRAGALGLSLASFPAFYKYTYINIPPHQTFGKTVNISEILKKDDVVLLPDKYQLSMRYSNGNGENCIFGSFDVAPLKINVTQ